MDFSLSRVFSMLFYALLNKINKSTLPLARQAPSRLGLIEGNYYFHSHLMMWGSWAVLDNPPQELDRRERSRIIVPDACAILYSAPIFNLGAGNPFEIISNLRTLCPEILPYPDEKPFDAPGLLQKLLTPKHSQRTIVRLPFVFSAHSGCRRTIATATFKQRKRNHIPNTRRIR